MSTAPSDNRGSIPTKDDPTHRAGLSTDKWYVVVRPDNGYPVLVYAEKERADLVARKNGYRVVPVMSVTES